MTDQTQTYNEPVTALDRLEIQNLARAEVMRLKNIRIPADVIVPGATLQIDNPNTLRLTAPGMVIDNLVYPIQGSVIRLPDGLWHFWADLRIGAEYGTKPPAKTRAKAIDDLTSRINGFLADHPEILTLLEESDAALCAYKEAEALQDVAGQFRELRRRVVGAENTILYTEGQLEQAREQYAKAAQELEDFKAKYPGLYD